MMFPKPSRATAERQAALREYRKARLNYLRQYPKCERCSEPAREVHHRRGRMGTLMSDTAYFMAVCVGCHRWIHDNPAESYKLGYLVKRNRTAT